MNIELVNKAIPLIEEGKSWRKIAEILGVAKSTLSDSLREYYNNKEKRGDSEKSGPRILAIDIETSPSIAAAFGRHKVFLTQDHILSEGGVILCAGYKWVGEGGGAEILNISGQSLFDCDDTEVVLNIWDLYEQADAVVAHNSRGFDHPMIQARVLFHGLPPLPSVKVLDTLQQAKKNFRLPNNKLDSIAAFLGLHRKVDSGGIETWIQYMMGNPEAVAHMHEYCLMDTELLEEVYLKLRAFGHSGTDFNAAHYHEDTKLRCNVCGSPNVELTGRNVFTAISEFKEVRCSSCGAVSRTRQAVNTVEKRRSIVVSPKT